MQITINAEHVTIGTDGDGNAELSTDIGIEARPTTAVQLQEDWRAKDDARADKSHLEEVKILRKGLSDTLRAVGVALQPERANPPDGAVYRETVLHLARRRMAEMELLRNRNKDLKAQAQDQAPAKPNPAEAWDSEEASKGEATGGKGSCTGSGLIIAQGDSSGIEDHTGSCTVCGFSWDTDISPVESGCSRCHGINLTMEDLGKPQYNWLRWACNYADRPHWDACPDVFAKLREAGLVNKKASSGGSPSVVPTTLGRLAAALIDAEDRKARDDAK